MNVQTETITNSDIKKHNHVFLHIFLYYLNMNINLKSIFFENEPNE